MAVTLTASGTQTCTVTTEHFVSSPNVAGEFVAYFDLSDMAAGDVVELRAYKMAIAGGTARVLYYQRYEGVQPSDNVNMISLEVPNTLTDANAVRFSIKQTFGVSCDIPWSVLNTEDATAVADIATAVWGAVTRTLSAFAFTPSLHADYDAAKTAASPTDVASALNTYDAPTKAELDSAVVPLALQATLVLVPAAAASAVTSDHGAGSYIRNTEPPTAAQNADGLLDLAAGVETGLTLRQAMRLLLAAEAGKLSGAATTTIVIKNAVADNKNRITATVDSSGNRTAITYDLT